MRNCKGKTITMILISSLLLISCASVMKFDRSATLSESISGDNMQMEFIGFKGSYDTLGNDFEMWQQFKRNSVLAKLGSVLQNKGIAYDQSFAYFGIYSLQEIAAYKSEQRYVTFIEIEKNSFTYEVHNKLQKVFSITGSSLVGAGLGFEIVGIAYSNDEFVGDLAKDYMNVGLGFSLAGLAFLIPAMIPPKTTISFDGIYNIYVYDTAKEEIIFRDTVVVGPVRDQYIGSYDDPGTNKEAVWNYYSTLVYNEIIKKYDEVYRFLESRE